MVRHGNLRRNEVLEDMTAIDREEFMKRMEEEAKREQKEYDRMTAKARAQARKAKRK